MLVNSYKLLKANTDEYGVVNLPQNVIPIGIHIDSTAGIVSVVILQKYEEWAKQNPEAAENEKRNSGPECSIDESVSDRTLGK